MLRSLRVLILSLLVSGLSIVPDARAGDDSDARWSRDGDGVEFRSMGHGYEFRLDAGRGRRTLLTLRQKAAELDARLAASTLPAEVKAIPSHVLERVEKLLDAAGPLFAASKPIRSHDGILEFGFFLPDKTQVE